VELSRAFAARRSSRAFNDRPVEPQKLERLLEAARWAPSASNRQPWRFVVVSRDASTRLAVEAALDPGNAWARRAPLLIVTCARRADGATSEGREYWAHDTGLALMSLVHRAVDLGLVAHPMAGFDEAALRTAVWLPDDVLPWSVTAVGYAGRLEDLDPETRAKEERPRTRKVLGEIAFAERYGELFEGTLRDAPERYFEADVALRFRDIDAMGHVNNAVVVTLLEHSRLMIFNAVFGAVETLDFPFILAEITVRYRTPIKLSDRVQVRMHVTDVARSAFRFRYELRDPGDGRVFVEAESTQVAYDYRAGRAVPLSPSFLAKLEPYVGG
jgi:YbgC/YbaW family acyl-CoA thioester hydrolase